MSESDKAAKPDDDNTDDTGDPDARWNDGGIVTIGDEVVYDGEAEFLGKPSKVGQKMPLPESMLDDSEVEDDA
jgi:hypothetical protein